MRCPPALRSGSAVLWVRSLPARHGARSYRWPQPRSDFFRGEGDCFSRTIGEKLRSSGFHLVIAELDSERPLNRFYGDYQCTVSIAGDQNSFDAVEGSSPNPHVLAHFEERAEHVRSINPQKSPDAI